jgi:hypothetical protein
MLVKNTNLSRILVLIIVSLVLRFSVLQYADQLNISDAKRYYEVSANLDQNDLTLDFTQKKWYDFAPIHILFLYLTDRNLIVQIFLSVITVLILYNVNNILGWIWCFYPVSIFNSVSYFKENLLFFFIAVILWLYHYKSKWFLVFLPFVFLGFTGFYSISYNQTVFADAGLMHKFWRMWKPEFNILCYIDESWNYILLIPYSILIICYIRTAEINMITIMIFFYTLTVTYIHGYSRFREPILIFIIYEVIRKIHDRTSNKIFDELF